MENEKRFIYANEFWNRLQNVVYDIFEVHEKDGQLTGTASVGYYTETIKEVLKQTKTVDAVEVVHGQNITKQHPVDEFICSECGLVCRDNGRYVYDEWADDWSLYEFEFKYCPNCGAKMDGDGNG